MEIYRRGLDPQTYSGQLMQQTVDLLTGRGTVHGRRAWRWEDRMVGLEELLSDYHGDEKALERLWEIIGKHRYLRRTHPGLRERARELLLKKRGNLEAKVRRALRRRTTRSCPEGNPACSPSLRRTC